MFKDIKGKRVLISGASGGIGYAVAKLFASFGAVVGVHYNDNEKRAKEVVDAARMHGSKAGLFRADLSNHKEVKGLCESFI